MPRKHGDFPSVRDAILYTASSLFTQKGVHGTSDIAAEAKLSKGTLYYYYSTKDELIVTITDDCLCHMTDILFSWVDGLNREEALRPALIRLFESLMADEHNARLYCVLCAECASEDTPIRELMTEYKQKWRLMLELGALKLQSRNAGRAVLYAAIRPYAANLWRHGQHIHRDPRGRADERIKRIHDLLALSQRPHLSVTCRPL